eukprot:gnl/MRDRNA2_/MRDRNA2_107443_c0_seq1.p1 gnl/MRDRNA2_/MRDRNA2_107443_c0~~gnl/MRDRNA2_/MRDRNA2_107443_c0_seq1.p1  ORF type:complete len:765 (-),score=158.24 gnl/MRDRNA2_/MRDRNA2_107443_c0_seq1:355-2565(-)
MAVPASKLGAAIPVLAVGVALTCMKFELVSLSLLLALIALALIVLGFKSLFERAVFFLDQDEQLRVQGFTDVYVCNGPGVKVLNPLGYLVAEKRTAKTLSAKDYVKVVNATDGSERIEKGPQLLFLGEYDEVKREGQCMSLSQTEYVRVEDMLSGEITVVKGPTVWFPGPHDEGRRGKAITITSTEYVTVQDNLTGNRHQVKGPCVWYPGPHEEGFSGSAVSLNSTEYIIVEDIETGVRRLVKGPCNWFPGVNDQPSAKKNAIALQDDEYIKLKDSSSGNQWIARGEQVLFLEPTWEATTTVKKAWALKAFEYVRLLNATTGKTTVYRGEQTVFPGPHDDLLDGKKMTAIDLKVHEYVKIVDQATSTIRVVKGPMVVFLEANERMVGSGKCQAVEIDDEHAVLVRDKSTGKQRLVTEKQLFFPAEHEKIEEVRELIKLADHEAMIIKDGSGDFHYYYGSDEKRGDKPRSFFLPAYSEIVGLNWSRGRKRDIKGLLIHRFDCRPQFMNFEFNCRTSDNVELVLEGTFFWEVVDLPKMVNITGDTSGDLCNHARSQFIRLVSKVTLKQFMETLHDIATQVFKQNPDFYERRGVKVHSLEVTGYKCADRSTSEILEQIIQETTNRMNRLSQQESENEVQMFKTNGLISQEKEMKELLEIQHAHKHQEARVQGISEATSVAAFMKQLEKQIPDLQERIKTWETLRKSDALAAISEGNAELYYTPNTANLSIKACSTGGKY